MEELFLRSNKYPWLAMPLLATRDERAQQNQESWAAPSKTRKVNDFSAYVPRTLSLYGLIFQQVSNYLLSPLLHKKKNK